MLWADGLSLSSWPPAQGERLSLCAPCDGGQTSSHQVQASSLSSRYFSPDSLGDWTRVLRIRTQSLQSRYVSFREQEILQLFQKHDEPGERWG